MSHTPGPWSLSPESESKIGLSRINVYGNGTQVACVPVQDDADRQNARLIAAAPDLLESLERLTRVAGAELYRSRPDVIEQAMSAITKAKGL